MSEQMRKEFESWLMHNGDNERNLYRSLDGDYINVAVKAVWISWQASRQSLVVKLPELFNATFCDAYEADAMKEVLDDAGVKYE